MVGHARPSFFAGRLAGLRPHRLIREHRPWPRRAQAVCLRTLRWGLPQEEGASPPSPRRRVSEPYRLECVDTFSNILYVKESKRELSSLAHACVQVDKYRPETCCVIGNYYSLKAEHEKAVLYFRRALKLNIYNPNPNPNSSPSPSPNPNPNPTPNLPRPMREEVACSR